MTLTKKMAKASILNNGEMVLGDIEGKAMK